MIEQHTRDMEEARAQVGLGASSIEQAQREVAALPDMYRPAQMTVEAVEAALLRVQQEQAVLVPRVTQLQQNVEQLSALAQTNQPVIFLPPNNIAIQIEVVRLQW